MITRNYRNIPQAQVEKLATRYAGFSMNDTLRFAKRKGETVEPILVITKLNLCIAYYPSPDLDALLDEMAAKRDSELAAAQAELEKPHALNYVRNVVNSKMAKQGLHFKFPQAI